MKASPELNGKLNLIVTAEHGMAQIPLQNRIELHKVLTYSKMYKGSNSPGLVGLWPQPGYNATFLYQKINDSITAGTLKNCRVWLKENLQEPFHLARSYRMPPVFLLGDSGYLVNIQKNSFTIKPDKKGTYCALAALLFAFLFLP
ncbi:unnamed protein product [Dibothriocephalus latus]|uniref:AP3A hydrolase n=1 Tax=Dibothriocephalus latus TaxID=60516 RepID=A0A3P7PH60_DIBLA|nr:unnamed protein product [Dibothriocephalus latus]